MPLPLTVSCFSKIQIGFTFLVPAHPGSPRQRAVKWVCVCVCVVIVIVLYIVTACSFVIRKYLPHHNGSGWWQWLFGAVCTSASVDHLKSLFANKGSDCWWSLPVKELLPDDVISQVISLPKTVLSSDSVAVFKSRLKTFLLASGFLFFFCSLTRCLAPAPLKFRPYGAIQICLLLLLLLLLLVI